MREYFAKNVVYIVVIAVMAFQAFNPDSIRGENDRPNIVLCMADDQGWGDVGYRENAIVKTPVLDEMAKNGIRMDRFYAAAPVCSPTRGSVLTGRHPNRFGCFSWGHRIRPQEHTVAEMIKKCGYKTAHFGKWHLGPVVAKHGANPGASGFDRWFSASNFYENDSLMSDQGTVVRAKGESSKFTMDEAIKFIRDCDKSDQPFFAVVWFGSPHGPHIATQEFLDLYPNQPKKKQHFLGEVSGIDAAMGQLRNELDNLGIRDNTLVWYTSDNGALPVGSTGGLSGRKGNLREGGIRVPSIIEWPNRIKKPMVTERVCGTVDIFPTVLAVAGLRYDLGRPLDGEALIGLLDGNQKSRTKPLGFWVQPAGGISTRADKILEDMLAAQKAGKQYVDNGPNPAVIGTKLPIDQFEGNAAWIDQEYKLLIQKNKDKSSTSLLFDLSVDPAEKNNLAEKLPEKVKSMEAALKLWQISVAKSNNGEDY